MVELIGDYAPDLRALLSAIIKIIIIIARYKAVNS